MRKDCLLEILRDDSIEACERAAAGTALAQIDPRAEVLTVDGMEFCWVPAGPFWLGREGDAAPVSERDKRESPRGQCEMPYDFWIGRYPVTVAQLREFLDAEYQAGKREDLSVRANEPVAWVTWYEAVNFCLWLTERWRKSGRLRKGEEVQLPSEAEWEKASRGGLEIPSRPVIRPAGDFQREEETANSQPMRRYPWGEDADPNRANYRDTGLGIRSAVGCFPSGASPYGCEDMSGNVWEWTRTLWGDGLDKPWFRYPYVKDDGREDLNAGPNVWRVLRGGAFDDDSSCARCAFRIRYPPDERKSGIGFRVALYRGST